MNGFYGRENTSYASEDNVSTPIHVNLVNYFPFLTFILQSYKVNLDVSETRKVSLLLAEMLKFQRIVRWRISTKFLLIVGWKIFITVIPLMTRAYQHGSFWIFGVQFDPRYFFVKTLNGTLTISNKQNLNAKLECKTFKLMPHCDRISFVTVRESKWTECW